jgi:hypothetical protein
MIRAQFAHPNLSSWLLGCRDLGNERAPIMATVPEPDCDIVFLDVEAKVLPILRTSCEPWCLGQQLDDFQRLEPQLAATITAQQHSLIV